MLRTWLRRFWREERGSVFVIAALAAMGVIGTVGIAVDAGRAQMAQNKLQNALDAAGLAAGSSLNADDLQGVVNKYLQVNFAQGNLGATITDLHVVLSDDEQRINVDATATLPTTFMKLFGHDMVTLHAATEITRTNKGMELALVLDTTGSMAGSKLNALQTASHDLLDILFGNDATSDNLWVGVVPFSQAVNIGTSHLGWIDAAHYATLNWGPTSWAGCVEARYANGRDVTDDVPATEAFKAYYWPDNNSYNNWMVSGTSSNTVNSNVCGPTSSNSCRCTSSGGSQNCSCSTTTSGNTSTQTCITCSGSKTSKTCTKSVTTTTTTSGYTIDSEHGPNKYCPSTLTQLSNVKADSVAGIDALVARGNTHVSEGAAWGWRLLSPNWRGLWGGSMNTNNLPLDYNTPLMVKAAIIMTDGENTISNSVDGAYGYLSQGQLGTTSSSTATVRLNDKLTSVCNAMKAKGIYIYTILFEENTPSVVTLMQNCATSPDYFFNSPDEATLQSAFHTIGDSLANLRISH